MNIRNARSQIRRYPTQRRGMAVIVVMLLLSMTLALSYTVMRNQSAAVMLTANNNLDTLARQAAQTGFAVALRKMSDTTWGGVGTTTTTSMTTNQSYTITYQTGDSSLTATSANYADLPYRVTILVVGKAADPSRATVNSQFSVAAVVRLMPRQLATPPATLTTATSYTVYQIGTNDFELQLPCQVAGPVRVQGTFRLCDTYPSTSNGLSRYLGDLNTMRSNGYDDLRPVTGPVSVPNSKITGATLSLLTTQLGVTRQTISSSTTSGWSFPGTMSTYRLFAGGQAYTIPAIDSTLANIKLAPNTLTNPLGLFFRNGSVTLNANVTVTGTIIANGNVILSGQGITLQPVALAGPVGSSQGAQMPAVIGNGDFRVASGAAAVVRGLVAVWGDFDCLTGTSSTAFDFQGRLICNGFKFEERSDWNVSGGWWGLFWSWFGSQLSPITTSTIFYYPVYMTMWGMNPTPILTVAPETTPVTYVWKDQTNTPYVPGSSDSGLCWQVLTYSESF